MSQQKLSDGEGKGQLRQWPLRTRALWSRFGDHGFWLRAQPKEEGENGTTPRLFAAGTKKMGTQPDGMWCFFVDRQAVDVTCIEICGSMQNLNDKRARYAPTGHGLVLDTPECWLRAELSLQKRGRRSRWWATGTLPRGEEPEHLAPAVRYLRVLYAVRDDHMTDVMANVIAAGHEYFTRHSALKQFNGQPMQTFLKRLAPASHFGP